MPEEEKEEKKEETKAENDSGNWDRLKSIVHDAVKGEFAAWAESGTSKTSEETPTEEKKRESTGPKKGFLSDWFKGLDL